jgi:hypothetical protein
VPVASAYNKGVTSDRCEIFYVKCNGKLSWKWRVTAESGAIDTSHDEYELFYECLSAARKRGFTPTYGGLRMYQQGDPSGFSRRAPELRS